MAERTKYIIILVIVCSYLVVNFITSTLKYLRSKKPTFTELLDLAMDGAIIVLVAMLGDCLVI